ncbi:MAG: GEVED domain-containing protein [Desulfobacterales bacterium]|nr:GEVED domain-containing protein [Desulfobacterales bacterium]
MAKRNRVVGCILFGVLFGLMVGAGPVSGAVYDYGDAQGYDGARHQTGQWQRLGYRWDRESSPLANDSSDDGVKWSVDGGDWGNSESVSVGQTIQFQFDFRRAKSAAHKFDQLGVWMDWNGDRDWKDDDERLTLYTDSSASFYDNTEDNYNKDHYAGAFGYGGTWAREANVSDLNKFFYSETFEIPNGVDVLWLRARVVCSSSIYNLADGFEFDPHVNLVQGEVED